MRKLITIANIESISLLFALEKNGKKNHMKSINIVKVNCY